MIKKNAAILAECRIAANDNFPAIDPKDVAVADRGHWLGNLEKGKGYTGFESHPYRVTPTQTVSRFAAVRWRALEPAPIPANDRLPRTGRRATAAERKTAAEGLPIEMEIKTDRVAGYLGGTIEDVRECYETASNPVRGGFRGAERHCRAVQACQLLRFRVMHLWRPLVDACVFGKTMSDIGREYGGNKEDAAKLGRQKVVDALLIAREAFLDLREYERQDAASVDQSPLPVRHHFALGRKSGALPAHFHAAANGNVRSIASVA